MDPKVNIIEQIAAAGRIITAADSDNAISPDDALQLAELALALHEWRAAGGFDPYSDAQFARLVRP